MDKYTLKTAFQKSFLGLVWRIEVDVVNRLMATETRDEQTGVPRFSTFRYVNGESLIREIPYGDRNWTLAGIVSGKLILRTFGQNSPNSIGIACIDATDGQVLWEQFNYTLLAIRGHEIIARHRNFADGYEQYLSVDDGSLTQKDDGLNKPIHPNIVIPKQYLGKVPMFLQHYAIVGELHHCSVGSNDVWAFHERDDQSYHVRLVISSDLDVLANEVVISNLVKMTPELFFMLNDQIFLIGNNKRKIVSYLV